MEKSFFYEVLESFIKRSGQSLPHLQKESGVPLKTIESWLEGRVEHPRHWRDLLRLAKAMRLSLQATNELLESARHKPLHELLEVARDKPDQEALNLLAFWADEHERRMEAVQRSQTAIFQAVPALTNLVGREREYEQLKSILISGGRVCVLRGMSGVGKTVLATKAAYQLREHFLDGVLWAQVDKSSTESILRSFANAYGVDVSECHDEGTLGATVRSIFANKRVLMVLDSVYNLKEVEPLLPPTTGGCAVIITTTNQRILEYEAICIDLKPLDVASGTIFFETIMGRERIKDAGDDVARVIRLVNGLPLALKIIASNLANMAYSMTVREYYDLLHDEQIRRDEIYERDESSTNVRVSFEVSYKLLKDRLKKLVSCLSLFKGTDFSVEAVAHVFDMSVPQLKMELGHLYALSLVEASTVKDYSLHALGRPEISYHPERYRLHTMLAFFAAEKLTQDFRKELPVYQARAVAYYAGLAKANPDNFQRLELEWENIVAVLPWAIEQGEFKIFLDAIDALTAIKLGVIGFLDAQGHWCEALPLLKQALNVSSVSPDALQLATLHLKLGLFSLRLADYQQAEIDLQQALTVLTTVPESEATLLCGGYTREAFAQVMLARGHPKQARAWAKEGIDTVQRMSTVAIQSLEGYLKIRLATILARNLGDLAGARLEIEKGLKLLPGQPTPAHVSGLMTLGIICNLQGEPKQAKVHWQAGVKAAETTGDNRRLAGLWHNLAAHADEHGNFTESLQYNQQALALYHRIGDVEGEALVASNLAFTYLVQQGDAEKAQPYLEAAEKLAQVHQLTDVELFAMVNRAHWHLHFQAYDQASALLHEAGKRSEEIGEKSSQAEILRLEAGIALHNQDYVNALALIDRALEIAGENKLEAGISCRLQGEIYRAMNNVVQAQAAYQQSLRLLEQYPFEKSANPTGFRIALCQIKRQKSGETNFRTC